MKVAQLAAYVSEKTCYHHGEVSLADTIVRLANNYVGSNNVALLVPCGQFGTRLMGGKDASATRYIFTKLDPIARKIFDARDDPVLRYLEDDGTPIEPDFFVPVLPMVLINGTEGIGTGFSTFVPPYKPEDVRANVARCVRGEEMVPMAPYFNGFEGRVYATDDGAWVAEGVFANGVITELPPGRWTQDHKEFLDGLVESKKISGYENNSTTERVRFKITGYHGKDPVADLKLRKTFRLSNMHLFHPVQGIKKYSSPLEIIRDFVGIRMECYQRRKAHIVAELRAKVDLNDNKARFIADVVSGSLVVFRRRRADLESDMAKSFAVINGGFSYLLDIKTHQYTEEAIQNLMREVDACKGELDAIIGKNERDMWLEDLRL
jgi:DNA topoisomerase-2